MVKRKNERDWDDEFFDDMFGDFGFDFDKINERIRKMMERMVKDTPEGGMFNPFMYGFTYKVGPDGKPSFQEFGNVPQKSSIGYKPQDKDVREPVVDVNYDDNNAYVTVELPGVAKEDIELSVSETGISIEVNTEKRKYYKYIDLEREIKAETAKAKFSNGILDMTIELNNGRKEKGKSVKIE